MISDVFPIIVIYLNRKFEIPVEIGIEVVRKSTVLKDCKSDNTIIVQEWLNKMLKELDLSIDSDKETAKNKIIQFIKS